MRIESFEERTYEIRMSVKEYNANIEKIQEHVKSVPNVTGCSTFFDSEALMIVAWTVFEQRLASFEELENLK